MGTRGAGPGVDWAGELRRLAGGARARAETLRKVGQEMLERAYRDPDHELTEMIDRFSLATAAVQAVIYDVDLATRRIVRSAGLQSLLGFDPREVPDSVDWWHDRIHPDDLPDLLADARRDAESGWVRSAEYRVLHRDGHWVHVWDRSIVVKDDQGRPVRLVGSTIDITERTAAQQRTNRLLEIAAALSRALTTEEIVRTVLEVAVPAAGADGGSVTLIDPDTDEFVTAGAVGHPERLVERWRRPPRDGSYPLADAVRTGQPIWIGSHAEWEARFPETLPDFIESGFRAVASLPLVFENRLLGGIGFDFREEQTFPAAEQAFMRAVADQCCLALERARLFEAERRSRAAAAAAEERYRALFDNSVDAIIAFDQAGNVVEANLAALRLLRVDSRARPLPTFARLIDLPPLEPESTWQEILAEGVWMREHELLRPDGSRVPVESRADRIGRGDETLVIVAMRDISARRAAERTQQAFLASISHDLKSPLSGIDLQTQLLKRRAERAEPVEPGELLRRTGSMLVSTRRMSEMIDELVDVAQIRLGHTLELQRIRLDLVELVDATTNELQGQGGVYAIRLSAPGGAVVGRWDGRRLRRVFDNLLSNAIKYSRPHGEIRVTVERQLADGEAWAVVAIEDDGIGIPAADLPHIFDSFRRGTNVGGRPTGHGVGLSGAREIVRQHGGEIRVTSEEGKGSRFEVWVPLQEERMPARTGRGHRSTERAPLMAHRVHEPGSGGAHPG